MLSRAGVFKILLEVDSSRTVRAGDPVVVAVFVLHPNVDFFVLLDEDAAGDIAMAPNGRIQGFFVRVGESHLDADVVLLAVSDVNLVPDITSRFLVVAVVEAHVHLA